MKCMIIDDEELAIKVIESHLSNLGGVEVVGTFQSANAALLEVQQREVDLIFLDIEMPGISGLQFIKTLNNRPKIIITTAYRDYAIEGYEYDVVDYLLKPISLERLAMAVSKVMSQIGLEERTINVRAPASAPTPDFIYVRSDREYVKVNLDEIIYIESLKNHVKVHTADGSIITLVAISKLLERLPQQSFVRIHKMYVVALKRVVKYTTSYVEVEGMNLPVGRVYKEELIKRLGDFSL